MNAPEISIVLPAYNCGSFLKEAIESMLNQSFEDFELIIINDGSTDKTEDVIKSFSDPRIIYLKNEKNSGLVYTLNKGIDIAKGNYIARMDGDDIALPTRLAKQKAILDEHPEISAAASTITFINEKNEPAGDWQLDKATIHSSEIKRCLPHENCIAHPSVMIRSQILKELKYNPYQKNIEDYDLWLRIMSRGYSITKVEEPQILYRIHDSSITSVHLKKKNFFFKHFTMKRKFIWNEWKRGNFNRFTIIVFFAMLADAAKGFGKEIKNIFKK
jgi:glycosyltransferase involved in cell wall biosynthesis